MSRFHHYWEHWLQRLLLVSVVSSGIFLSSSLLVQAADAEYVQPVPGLAIGVLTLNTNQIIDSLIADGYRAQCGSTQALANVDIDNLEAFLKNNPDQNILIEDKKTYKIDFDQEDGGVGLSLLRSDDSEQDTAGCDISDSVECYTSTTAYELLNEQEKTIAAPAIEYLLSLEQRMVQSVKTLETIESKCGLLASIDACPELNKTIPGTNKTAQKILKEYRDSALTPEEIANGANDKLRQELAQVPLAQDKTKRLAAFVFRVRGKRNVFFRDLLSGGGDETTDKVKVVLVPISGTETDENLDNDYALGANQLVGNISRSYTDIKDSKEQTQEFRATYAQKAKEVANKGFNEGDVINCHSIVCQLPPIKALNSMIVAQDELTGLNCQEQVKVENATLIKDSTSLPDVEDGSGTWKEGEFSLRQLGELLGIGGGSQESEFELVSQIGIGPDAEGNNEAAPIDIFYIGPSGEGYDVAAETLNTFLSLQQVQSKFYDTDGEKLKNGLGITGNAHSFQEEDPAEFEFTNQDKCQYDEDGELIEDSCNDTLVARVKAFANQLFVPKGLGLADNLTKGVALVVNRYRSNAWNHAQNSNTVQDYLRGISAEKTLEELNRDAAHEIVAQCNGDTNTVPYGADAKHWCTDTNQQCSTAELEELTADEEANACTLFKSNLHNISNWNQNVDVDPAICNKLYGPAACIFIDNTTDRNPITKIENTVNENGQFDAGGNQTACEYVVNKLNNDPRGVNTTLGLAMWAEESGFSSEGSSGRAAPSDFGVISQPTGNLEKQINSYLNTLYSKNDYELFLLQYSEGLGKSKGDEFCSNRYFPGRIKEFYDAFSKL